MLDVGPAPPWTIRRHASIDIGSICRGLGFRLYSVFIYRVVQLYKPYMHLSAFQEDRRP